MESNDKPHKPLTVFYTKHTNSVFVKLPYFLCNPAEGNDLWETSYVYIYIHLHQFFQHTHTRTLPENNWHFLNFKKHNLMFFKPFGSQWTQIVSTNHVYVVVSMSLNTCSHKPYTVHQNEHTHTHTHTHTRSFLWKVGTSHRRNGFYTVQTVCAIGPTPTLYLN